MEEGEVDGVMVVVPTHAAVAGSGRKVGPTREGGDASPVTSTFSDPHRSVGIVGTPQPESVAPRFFQEEGRSTDVKSQERVGVYNSIPHPPTDVSGQV